MKLPPSSGPHPRRNKADVPRTVEPAGLPQIRPPSWKWIIAGLLLLATTINYLDRQTLSTLSKRIIADFQLDKEQYGDLEMAFGLAFAAGCFSYFAGWS